MLNLVGAFLSTEVAKTISGGIVDDTQVTPGMIFAGLVGAILWNLLTWLVGLPSSSSHALFGGLIGAVWVAVGRGRVHFDKVVEKVLIPAVASPIVAGVAALIATYLAYRLTARARQDSVTKGFRLGQIASASLVSLAHGTNDAQKTMGVITLTLIPAGALGHDAGPPVWVIASAGSGHRAGHLPRAAGGSSGPWARASPRSSPRRASPPRPRPPRSSSPPSHLGFALSTTQVASGASSAPGRLAGPRACAGASPARSPSRGC